MRSQKIVKQINRDKDPEETDFAAESDNTKSRKK
jgi:hypothetical protein